LRIWPDGPGVVRMAYHTRSAIGLPYSKDGNQSQAEKHPFVPPGELGLSACAPKACICIQRRLPRLVRLWFPRPEPRAAPPSGRAGRAL